MKYTAILAIAALSLMAGCGTVGVPAVPQTTAMQMDAQAKKAAKAPSASQIKAELKAALSKQYKNVRITVKSLEIQLNSDDVYGDFSATILVHERFDDTGPVTVTQSVVGNFDPSTRTISQFQVVKNTP